MTLVRTRPNPAWPVRHDPFDGFDRLFDQLARPTLGLTAGELAGSPLDLYETDDDLILEMPVPGLAPDQIDVSLEGGQLTVRADVPAAGGEDRRYWLQSIPRGTFSRSLKLPVGVDADAIEARVRHGILTLRMPKAQEAKARRIAVAQD